MPTLLPTEPSLVAFSMPAINYVLPEIFSSLVHQPSSVPLLETTSMRSASSPHLETSSSKGLQPSMQASLPMARSPSIPQHSSSTTPSIVSVSVPQLHDPNSKSLARSREHISSHKPSLERDSQTVPETDRSSSGTKQHRSLTVEQIKQGQELSLLVKASRSAIPLSPSMTPSPEHCLISKQYQDTRSMQRMNFVPLARSSPKALPRSMTPSASDPVSPSMV